MSEPLERLEARARDIARLVERQLDGTGWLFSVLFWSQGDEGHVSYIANAHRDDVERGMRELINRWAKGERSNLEPPADPIASAIAELRNRYFAPTLDGNSAEAERIRFAIEVLEQL